jgi:hypothetical protein
MRPFRLSFHPFLIVVFGLASGALALGAASLGSAGRDAARAPRRAGLADAASSGGPSSPAQSAASLPALTASMRAGSFLSPQPDRPAASALPRFPALYERAALAAQPRVASTEPISPPPSSARRSALIPAIANNQILAFYGKPDSRSMGILGEYSKEDLTQLLDGYARLYDERNGDEGVVAAFYLIYGTCWPEGEIGYLKDSVVKDYIDFAAQRGMLVFVDHQIGKYPVADAMRRLLPWLKYPNVHIALDPEWRTDSPMRVIGSVSADEINEAEAAMSDFMNAEGIEGQKMLVIHQFQSRMITDRERVRADYDGVLLVHTADGFGPPVLKRASYAYNSRAANMPLKGFKLFFKTDVEGAGSDEPLLLPAEVLGLDPRPRLIIYQ